jgi:hypothetical protein
MKSNRQTSDIYDLIKPLTLLHRSHNDLRDIQHAAAALGPRAAGPEHGAGGYDAKRVACAQALRGGFELGARQNVALANDHGLALMRKGLGLQRHLVSATPQRKHQGKTASAGAAGQTWVTDQLSD